MYRDCPNCSESTIRVKDILFADSICRKCKRIVGVHRAASAFFSVVIFVVTVVTTFMVLVQQGFYAALLWFTLPVGALSYLKARFSPLETRAEPNHLRSVSGT